MFKKLISFVVAVVMVLSPMSSYAMNLGSAFSNLLGAGTGVSINAPGRYQSGARNGFSAGGLEIRAPRASHAPSLFSFTPPAIEAGCGGISATFGGFSFISGAEFEAMLKSLASGAAMGFVSMLAIKTLCPTCEAVIQFLKTAAQQAARLSKDACRWGQEMGAKFMDSIGMSGSGNRSRDYCSATAQKDNADGDYLGLAESIGGLCASMKAGVDYLLGTTGADSDPQKKAELACEVGELGNVTWSQLSVFAQNGAQKDDDVYRQKLLWMNLMGVQLGYMGEGNGAAKCETAPGSWRSPSEKDNNKPVYCPSRLEARDAMMLFMCGSESTSGSGIPRGVPEKNADAYGPIVEYCSPFFKSVAEGGTGGRADMDKMQVYYCADSDGSNENCNTVALGGIDKLVQNNGFMVQVFDQLLKGVDAVRLNTEMPKETIQLIQIAPFPLYQAINAAAVYPAGARDLISSIGTMVAEQMAMAYLDNMLKLTGNPVDGKKTCLSPAQASQLLDAMYQVKSITAQNKSQIASAFAVQEGITQQIRHVNLAIQRQVLSADLLATQQYSESVSKAVSAILPNNNPTPPKGDSNP